MDSRHYRELHHVGVRDRTGQSYAAIQELGIQRFKVDAPDRLRARRDEHEVTRVRRQRMVLRCLAYAIHSGHVRVVDASRCASLAQETLPHRHIVSICGRKAR